MVTGLLQAGHEVAIFGRALRKAQAVVEDGAVGASSFEELARAVESPRTVWLISSHQERHR
jgi:6-phosphogluconate dehydrogenase (decarboxylating)